MFSICLNFPNISTLSYIWLVVSHTVWDRIRLARHGVQVLSTLLSFITSLYGGAMYTSSRSNGKNANRIGRRRARDEEVKEYNMLIHWASAIASSLRLECYCFSLLRRFTATPWKRRFAVSYAIVDIGHFSCRSLLISVGLYAEGFGRPTIDTLTASGFLIHACSRPWGIQRVSFPGPNLEKKWVAWEEKSLQDFPVLGCIGTSLAVMSLRLVMRS